MFSRLSSIGIVKKTTERLSRKRAARGSFVQEKIPLKPDETIPEVSDSERLLEEEEEYLIVDIKDDGTPEVSKESPDYSLKLDFPSKEPKKAPAIGLASLVQRDKNFENVPL